MSITGGGGTIPPGRRKASGKFRRRPASGAEHERRVAFGKTWGAILSAHAKTYDTKRG